MVNLKAKYLPPSFVICKNDETKDVLTLSNGFDDGWFGDYDKNDEWGDY